jgi:hypothetical protein
MPPFYPKKATATHPSDDPEWDSLIPLLHQRAQKVPLAKIVLTGRETLF